MWGYLAAVLGLGALCAAWVVFQLWLKRADPAGGRPEEHCGGCGSCTRECDDKL